MVFDRTSQKFAEIKGHCVEDPVCKSASEAGQSVFIIVTQLNNVSNCLCAVKLIIIENRRLELEWWSVGRITRAVVLQSFFFVAASQPSCVAAAVRRPFWAKMVGLKLLNLSSGLEAQRGMFSTSAMTKWVWHTESYLSQWFCTQERLWWPP